jgi:hypothetical protein
MQSVLGASHCGGADASAASAAARTAGAERQSAPGGASGGRGVVPRSHSFPGAVSSAPCCFARWWAGNAMRDHWLLAGRHLLLDAGSVATLVCCASLMYAQGAMPRLHCHAGAAPAASEAVHSNRVTAVVRPNSSGSNAVDAARAHLQRVSARAMQEALRAGSGVLSALGSRFGARPPAAPSDHNAQPSAAAAARCSAQTATGPVDAQDTRASQRLEEQSAFRQQPTRAAASEWQGNALGELHISPSAPAEPSARAAAGLGAAPTGADGDAAPPLWPMRIHDSLKVSHACHRSRCVATCALLGMAPTDRPVSPVQ